MTARSLPIARESARWLATSLLALACGPGCIKPKDDYEDFSKRPLIEREASVVDVQLTACEELLKQDLTGEYLASCRPNDLKAPFALAVEQTVTPSSDGTGAKLALTFTSLKLGATNIAETTGVPTPLPETTLNSECAYKVDVGTLTLYAESNALRRDLTATEVVLRGKLQSATRSCAELDGSVDLIMLSLKKDGDYCVFMRPDADGTLPVVNDEDYACDPAGLPPR